MSFITGRGIRFRLLSNAETTPLGHKKPGQDHCGNKEDQQPRYLRKDRLHIAIADKDIQKALSPQDSGENSLMVCMILGMTKTGTMIPPRAAAMTTETAPNIEACS